MIAACASIVTSLVGSLAPAIKAIRPADSWMVGIPIIDCIR